MADEIAAPTTVIDAQIRGRCLVCGATTTAFDTDPAGEKAVAALMAMHTSTRHTPPPVTDAPSE